ncbi:fungal-specific transcription factor domain-containing protein [Aspergillus californicus]
MSSRVCGGAPTGPWSIRLQHVSLNTRESESYYSRATYGIMGSGRRTPRASVACAKCRLRKVRCDVARRGNPCMNCQLDEEECLVRPRGRPSRTKVDHDELHWSSPQSSADNNTHDEPEIEAKAQRRTPKRMARASDIPFQAYPFIDSQFLGRLDQDEICYLDSQSCFRLPVQSSWHSMLQVYFRHVNPLVPVLDEASFWRSTRENTQSSISLFVAQAVLFAACPFASRQTIKGCGFANCRNARAAFYRRAKLLYRMESESHPIAIIQGSLLLSLCSSTQTESPVNSVWLSIAVQHARSLGAHYPHPEDTTLPADWRELKRLWWVCLIRDRIISLGHRRPLQISYEDWESDLDLVASPEMYDEMCRSEVHAAPVRNGLFSVFHSVLRLCVPLTQILQLAVHGSGDCDVTLREADSCAESLQRWLDETRVRFDAFYLTAHLQDSVVLHDQLLQIYFHAAHVRILNFKITAIASLRLQHSLHSRELLQSGSAIEAAVEGIANSLSTLAQHDLVQYLPTSAVLCAALPFVLDAVYLDIVPPAQHTEAYKERTETFLVTVQAIKTRYNHVDPVTTVIDKVISLPQPRRPMTGWKHLIASQPGYYLAVPRALDVAILTGQLPCNEAQPVCEESCRDSGAQEMLEIAQGQTNDGLYEYFSTPEEDTGVGLGAQMADSRPSDPFLRDIFGLCQDQDIDTLLSMI